MPAASTSPLASSDVVDAEQLELLEAAYRLPAAEPRRAVSPRRRRTAAVARAASTGVGPIELAAAALFATLAAGAVTLVVLSIVA